MTEDGATRREAPTDAGPPPAAESATSDPSSWTTYVTGAPAWPAYGTGPADADGVDDGVPATVPPRRTHSAAGLAPLLAIVLAGIGIGTVAAGQGSQPTSPVVSRPQPAVHAGPQWRPVDPLLTTGLVRVEVTAAFEADGIVMTEDGLIATSYARVAGFFDSFGAVEAIELDVVADGGMPMPAEIVGFDAARDVAVLRVPGYTPASIAQLGTAVGEGDELTLLDDRGEGDPVVGYPISVTATDQPCSRPGAAMISRPRGFRFQLDVASAEPGGAVVADDGSIVGMYYGGDDGPHCAVPIDEVAEVVRRVALGEESGTTRIGPPGGLGVRVYSVGEEYPPVTTIDYPGVMANGAGVELGDLLLRVGDTSLREADLTTMGPEGVIRSLEPGDEVTIEWESDGVRHQATIEVGIGPQPRG